MLQSTTTVSAVKGTYIVSICSVSVSQSDLEDSVRGLSEVLSLRQGLHLLLILRARECTEIMCYMDRTAMMTLA